MTNGIRYFSPSDIRFNTRPPSHRYCQAGGRAGTGFFRGCLTIAVLALTGLWCASQSMALDLIAADVSGVPVTLSELQISASLAEGRLVALQETGLLRKAMERLVDQIIIIQEGMEAERLSGSPELAALSASLSLRAGGDDALEKLKSVLELSPANWQRLLERQAMVIRFIEERFRPFVSIGPEEINSFYLEELVPRLPAGAAVPGIDEVREQITGILQERRMTDEYLQWLGRRRKELSVKFLYPEPPANGMDRHVPE